MSNARIKRTTPRLIHPGASSDAPAHPSHRVTNQWPEIDLSKRIEFEKEFETQLARAREAVSRPIRGHNPFAAMPPRLPRQRRITLLGLVTVIVYLLSAALALTVLTLVFMSFIGAAAAAEPDREPARAWLTVNTVSWHPDRDYARENDLEAFNPGLGIEWAPWRELPELRAVGGAYRNSYRNTSWYAGASWTPLAVLGMKLGAMAGLVSGYPVYDNRIGPMVAAVAMLEGKRLGANLVYAPRIGDKSHGAVMLQLKVAL